MDKGGGEGHWRILSREILGQFVALHPDVNACRVARPIRMQGSSVNVIGFVLGQALKKPRLAVVPTTKNALLVKAGRSK
jgi:hypothetical protein